MKTVKLLVFVTILQLKGICVSSKSQTLALHAINSIKIKYFNNNSAKVDLINYRTSDKLIDEILRHKPASISVQVSNSASEFPWKNQMNISTIAIFDSIQNFKDHVKNIKWLSNPSMRHKHLVHVPGLSVSNVVDDVQDEFDIDQVDFLMNETEKSIDLVASFLFTSQKCRSNQLVTIKKFTRNTMTWENSNFYPKKYQNFHGCTLNVL